MTIKNQTKGLGVRKRFNHKEVMKLNDVASILNIDFKTAEELTVFMNEKTIDERYAEMLAQDEIDEIFQEGTFSL